MMKLLNIRKNIVMKTNKIGKYKKEYYDLNKKAFLEQNKTYRKLNKDKIVKQKKEYYEENKNKVINQCKEYRQLNKDKIYEHYRLSVNKKRASHPIFRLMRNNGTRIFEALKSNYKAVHTIDLLGCYRISFPSVDNVAAFS